MLKRLLIVERNFIYYAYSESKEHVYKHEYTFDPESYHVEQATSQKVAYKLYATNSLSYKLPTLSESVFDVNIEDQAKSVCEDLGIPYNESTKMLYESGFNHGSNGLTDRIVPVAIDIGMIYKCEKCLKVSVDSGKCQDFHCEKEYLPYISNHKIITIKKHYESNKSNS